MLFVSQALTCAHDTTTRRTLWTCVRLRDRDLAVRPGVLVHPVRGQGSSRRRPAAGRHESDSEVILSFVHGVAR